MTSLLINSNGGEFESIFIVACDNDDSKKSFPLDCEEDNDNDSEPSVVPIEDPLREPLCIELLSDIEDDDVCIINDDSGLTFVNVRKACGEPSSARHLKGDVPKDVVCSEKKVNTNNVLKKVDDAGHCKKSHCDYFSKQKTPKKKSRKVSYSKLEKQSSWAKATSEISDFFQEEKFHKTPKNSKLIVDKDLKVNSSEACISSLKSNKKERKMPLEKLPMISIDSFVNRENDMVLDNNSFKLSDANSVPESSATGNTKGDTNNDDDSTLMANDIMLLAWELEIKKQEELRKSSGRSRRKSRSCDCRLVLKTLSDDQSYATKRRVNYITKYTCCEFRKTVLGHVYYVPVITPNSESSSKNKRPIRNGMSKCKKKLDISVQEEFKDSGKD